MSRSRMQTVNKGANPVTQKNLGNGQVDGVITRPLVVQDRQVDGVIARPLVVKLFTHLDLCEKGAKFSLRRHMCRPKKVYTSLFVRKGTTLLDLCGGAQAETHTKSECKWKRYDHQPP